MFGDRERRRDLLIEHLHLMQDHFGCLHARHLAALAEEMRLALVEVYEVASFYAHFDIVMDGETPPPPMTVRVCDSLSCELAGAAQLLDALQPGSAMVCGSYAPRAWAAATRRLWSAIGHALHEHATVDASVAAAVSVGETHLRSRTYVGLHTYRVEGGYHLLQSCLAGERTRDQVIEALEHSGLRGLGGAGFPTGRKWRLRPAGAGAPACWRSMPTRASPAPSRTAISSKPTRTGSSKAC